jgi:hypothetical protein
MDDYPGTLFQSRGEFPQDLDAIRIRPIMENGTEIVDIRRDRLRSEEVAASILACISSPAIGLTVP